jgi:hypothetical protein
MSGTFKEATGARRLTQVVQLLLTSSEVLSSNPSTIRKKEEEEEAAIVQHLCLLHRTNFFV